MSFQLSAFDFQLSLRHPLRRCPSAGWQMDHRRLFAYLASEAAGLLLERQAAEQDVAGVHRIERPPSVELLIQTVEEAEVAASSATHALLGQGAVATSAPPRHQEYHATILPHLHQGVCGAR